MIYIIDTHAWIEYFIGSKQGLKLSKLFDERNNKFITMECCIAEIMSYCLSNNADFDKLFQIIKSNSVILPVLRDHWVDAARIRFEMRKKIRDFGLIDAVLIAKQMEIKCNVISGDYHFKNVKGALYIGN